MDPSQRDILYREYVRLGEIVESHHKSGFDDFKLLGAVGGTIILWKPIADLIFSTNPQASYSGILFLGFLSLLLVIVVIAFINLVRQSYVFFTISCLQSYENKIREEIFGAEKYEFFNFNLTKKTKFFTTDYFLTFGPVIAASSLAVVVMPTVTLYSTNLVYAAIYFVCALTALASYLYVVKKLFQRHFRSSKIS